jgi:hypothetical protein
MRVQAGGVCLVALDRAQLSGTTVSGSDWITIDGDSGNVYLGKCETVVKRPEAELAEIAAWRARVHDGQGQKSKSTHSQSARPGPGIRRRRPINADRSIKKTR